MTLNQLAWEMWERLGYKEIDPSVISRVLRGERLFTYKQLNSFCEILKLRSQESISLKTYLFWDLNQKFGNNIDFITQTDKSFTSLVDENLKKIRQLRQKDMPELTLDLIDYILELMRDKLLGFLNEDTRALLMKFYAELLIERMYCIQVTESKERGLAKILKTSMELVEVGKKLNNQSYISIASIHAGDIFYINSSFKSAIDHLKLGVMLYDNLAQKIFTWTPLRPLALSFAYLGKEREFDEVKKQITKILPALNIDAQVLAMEGISKGEGILGRRKKWEKWLERSFKMQSKLQKYNAPYEKLMRTLLIGSELEITRRLGLKANTRYINIRKNEGLEIAKKYGYNRFVKKINFFADEERFSHNSFHKGYPIE